MQGYVTIEEGCIAPAARRDPLVSIIVPAYNTAKTLDQALDSLEVQTLTNIEILVIDDGSTDDTLAIAQKHAARDERIRVISKPNGGYGSACNRGLDEARGKWIAILEPDDWVLPEMYRTMISFAKNFGDQVDIIKTPYWRICNPDTENQKRLNCSYRYRVKPQKQPFTIEEAPHLLRHHPSIWSALYRKGFLDENDIRFPEYPGAGWADNPFLIDTLCQAKEIVYLDKPFYCYREETPEEYAAFVQRTRTMPLERWQTMMDELKRLKVTNPVVMSAMIRRGFTYLNGIQKELGDDPDVLEAAAAMAKRMPAALVYSDAELSPSAKRLFALLRGETAPDASKAEYAASLVKEGLYTLRNNGVGYTLTMVAGMNRN